jgi:hypothetical protein
MKDAFGNSLKLGDKVIYSVKSSEGTNYVVGTVSKLHPHDPLDRVTITPTKTTSQFGFTKDPVVYAVNVVILDKIA